MKDLNVRQEAIKILVEKVGKNLFDLGRSNFLLNTSPEARETKAEMNYWDLIKIKSFCTARMRRKRISFALLVGMQAGAPRKCSTRYLSKG